MDAFQIAIARLPELRCEGECQFLRIDPEQVEIKEIVEVCTQQQSVRAMVRSWSRVGKDVGGIQCLFDVIARNRTAAPVSAKQSKPKLGLALPLDDTGP